MDQYTLRSKIGQLFVVGFSGKTISDEVKRLIHDYRVGNFILFGRNIGSGEEVLELTSKLQEEAQKAGHSLPLLICTDQENGVVKRLKPSATEFPGAMSLGAVNSIESAYQIGYATGLELKEVGINWNLAPVVDINNNIDNPVINVRSFGESPEKVKELALSWMKGCQDAGVATTLKHFPGHGDTNVDSHSDLPIISHSLERLFEVELVPFIEGIKNGADAIMTAHIYFTELEKRKNWPATVSENVISKLLREKLGFNGVVTTDCLEMNAISKTIGTANGAVEAIKAGADIAMISHTYHYQIEAITKLQDLVQKEEISIDRIEASVNRIYDLKKRYAQQINHSNKKGSFQFFGNVKHEQLAKNIYQKSVTIYKKRNNDELPILNRDSKVLAIFPGEKKHLQVEERIYKTNIEEVITNYPIKMDYYKIDHSNVNINECINKIDQLSVKYDHILFFTLSIMKDKYCNIIDLIYEPNKTIVISLRGPFSIKLLENVEKAICVYDDNKNAICAALDVLYGQHKPTGTAPVTF